MKGLREKWNLHSIAAMVPAVLMLTGVVELISERIHGLDRILSGKRLLRGFGVLNAGWESTSTTAAGAETQTKEI